MCDKQAFREPVEEEDQTKFHEDLKTKKQFRESQYMEFIRDNIR